MSLSCRAHYANTASNPVLLQCRDSVSIIVFASGFISITCMLNGRKVMTQVLTTWKRLRFNVFNFYKHDAGSSAP